MKRVLIVDDEPWQLGVYKRALESTFVVDTASDGFAAMQKIETLLPDAMVLDVLMPGNTVWALLQELQSHDDTAKIPTILITTMADEVALSQVKTYNVGAILDKTTLHPDDVRVAVEKVMS